MKLDQRKAGPPAAGPALSRRGFAAARLCHPVHR
jgi:hypothetical protein